MEVWLSRLQLSEYTELFEREGYSTAEDIENLKDLEESDLRAMGVSKRGMLPFCYTAIILYEKYFFGVINPHIVHVLAWRI